MKRPHFALPEIYDDSLSYYDVLRKLIKSIHAIVDNLNKIPEQIANEAKAREQADSTLQINIDNEAMARQEADNELRELISTSGGGVTEAQLNEEVTARQQADTVLDGKISELKGDLDNFREYNFLASRNRFNKDTIIQGILKNDGTINPNTSAYFTSDFIPINQEQYRICRQTATGTLDYTIRGLMFYDAEKNPLGTEYVSNPNPIGSSPYENTAYVRLTLTLDYIDRVMFFVDDVSDSYEYIPYKMTISLKEEVIIPKLAPMIPGLEKLFTLKNENLEDRVITNKYLNADGKLISSTVWNTYLLKPIYEKITFYGLSNTSGFYGVAFYSSDTPTDDNFISGIKYTASSKLAQFIITSDDIPTDTKVILFFSRVASGDGTSLSAEYYDITKKIANSDEINVIKSELNGKGNVKAIYKNIPNANDFTIIKDEIWFAENIYEDGVATDYTTVHRYKIQDGFLVKIGDIDTDFGHWNTVDYCEENDCLVFGNGSNSVETVGNYFTVVKNPLALGDVARIETCGIKYLVDIGFKVQAVWGDNNFGKYNIVYLVSNSCQKITKVMLLRDNNGNFVTDETTGYGKYITLETKDIELDKYYGVGGADFWEDTLYIGIGGPYEMFKMSMTDYEIKRITKHYYDEDGNEYSGSTQGVHIDSRYIWIFSNISGSSNTYLIQYYR